MMATTPASPMHASRGPWRGFAGFATLAMVLILGAAVALTLFFRGERDAQAIWISAAIAYVTQVAAFPVVRKLATANLTAGWGFGSLVRFGTLGLYALIAGLVLHLPMSAALVSLALFYFVSMVIEPLFLRS